MSKFDCPNPECDASYDTDAEGIDQLERCEQCGTDLPVAPKLTSDEAPPKSLPDTDLDPPPSLLIDIDLPSPFGRYQIIRTLGKGGMAAVYLAHDEHLDRMVALKVPHREYAQNPYIRERFLREARAAARFDHPNLCPIYDSGEIDGIPYLTMKFIEGGTLASTIEWGKPWEPRRAAEVVRQLALAMAEAHSLGIIHRDLKPANVMIEARGRYIITDFGLARRHEGGDPILTVPGAVMGTAAYMPPEQAKSDLDAIGPRSDVYSLGVILYQLLAGRLPFEERTFNEVVGQVLYTDAPPPSVHRPDLDPVLESICLKAMAKKQEARYASMSEFAEALASFLSGEFRVVGVPASEPRSLDQTTLLDARKRKSSPSSEPNGEVPGVPNTGPLPRGRLGLRSPIAVGLGAFLALATIGLGIIYVVIAKRPPASDLRQPLTTKPEPKKADIPPEAKQETTVGDIPKPKEVTKPPVKTPLRSKMDEMLITNTFGMKLRLIPAGEFDMGSDAIDPDAGDDQKVDGKKHHVRITTPFYLGTTEVTVGQLRRFVERAGYKTEAERDGKGGYGWNEAKQSFEQDPKYTWRSVGFPQTDDHPVVLVSWNDAVAFCDWLSREEGQTYRLPTEAEWEYSCRASQTSRFSSGDDLETLATIGNVADASAREKYPNWSWTITARDGYVFTAPVGRFRPNAFGLYDMHGNVWEWCSDWYDSKYYSISPSSDPLNSTQTAIRVRRGGSWRSAPLRCWSAFRYWEAPDDQYSYLGFRVALIRPGS